MIDAPLATVIAPISMDHTEFLGDTLAAIAREKAGIIKRGVPVICAEQPAEAIAVIEQDARKMRAPLYAAGEGWHVNVERGRLVYQDERGLMDLPAPKLFGRHQFDNAGLAIAALRAQDRFRIPPAAFEAGIVNAEWPARMQRLSLGALWEHAPPGCEIWLDGGHNAEGGRVAAAALGDLEERVSRPLVVIVGMMANKDASGIPRQFRRADPPYRRGADTGQRQCDADGAARGRRPRARHARGSRRQRRSGAARAGAARLRSSAAHPDHGFALSRRPRACRQRHAAGIGMKMRFAAIADVHGNYLALEAVIADIRAQGIEEIVDLGDMASGPLDARRTMDALMALDAVHVLGNHDRYLIDRPPEKMGSWDRPAHAQLEATHLDWLRAIPPTRVYRDQVFLCHATPESDEIYWLETVLPNGTVRMASLEAIEEAAKGIPQPLILCGHTHIARAVRLADGRLVVNPGSVGSPGYRDIHPYPHVIEAGTPDARYAILELADGSWRATFRHVPYDHAAMAALARRNGQPELASALATGWIR